MEVFSKQLSAGDGRISAGRKQKRSRRLHEGITTQTNVNPQVKKKKKNWAQVDLRSRLRVLHKLNRQRSRDPLLTRNPLHRRKQLQVDLASLRGDSGAHQEMLKPPKQWRG